MRRPATAILRADLRGLRGRVQERSCGNAKYTRGDGSNVELLLGGHVISPAEDVYFCCGIALCGRVWELELVFAPFSLGWLGPPH